MYMPQSTEEDEDESRQPLDQPYDFDPEKVSTVKLLNFQTQETLL